VSGRFADRGVLITGAGAGIGRALAVAYAREGAKVAVNDVDAGRARDAAAAVDAVAGPRSGLALPGDVADVGAVRAMVAEAARRFGRLDVVVANAGITVFGRFLDVEPGDLDRILGVNLRGSWFTAQAGARAMIAAGLPGRILLLSSVTGYRAIPGLGAYGVTKAGIAMMARVLAQELGPHLITVNALAPGATVTERTLTETADYERGWGGVAADGRAATVADVAAAALFLTSQEAAHVTGQTLVVDGGWTGTSPLPEGY